MRNLFYLNLTFIIFILIIINIASSAPQQATEINNQLENASTKDAEAKTALHVDINNEDPNVKDAETREAQHVDSNTMIDTAPITEDTDVESDRIVINDPVDSNGTAVQNNVSESIVTKMIMTIKKPLFDFIETPKVNMVLRNIGTCIVNGAMEIVTFYFPAPLIPLIASAAGMVIPFEPIVMLRKRMPVTSYRRAFQTAVNSFMGTFDRFKVSDEEEDPYMTRKFNRRFMGDN